MKNDGRELWSNAKDEKEDIKKIFIVGMVTSPG